MDQYVEAFSLGNAAILANVCLLPLYPGLFVMLAATAAGPDGRPRRPNRWLGVVVLAGIITFMIGLGFLLHRLSRTAADVVDWMLPALYLTVLGLGIAMLAGKNPFARVAVSQSPLLRSPTASAYLYGMFLAPMTLPCTGPLIVSAFVIGGVAGGGALAESLVYFTFFALGFGWPLVVLPLLAAPVQERATRFLTRHHRMIASGSGVLLIGIAVFGYWTEIRPGA